MAEIRIDREAPEVREGPSASPDVLERRPAEPSLGELFRQLAQDSTLLIRQEVALAKTEMRENVSDLARDMTMIIVGAVLAHVGLLALSAFFILILGEALANFWLAALIVAGIYLVVGGALAWHNLRQLRRTELKPEQAIDSMKENKRWLQQEIRDARGEPK